MVTDGLALPKRLLTVEPSKRIQCAISVTEFIVLCTLYSSSFLYSSRRFQLHSIGGIHLHSAEHEREGSMVLQYKDLPLTVEYRAG